MAFAPDGNTNTLALAKSAIRQIEALALPADPPNFELWYNYTTGFYQRLNAEINELLKAKGALTEEDLEGLLERHLVSRRSATQLSATARELSGEIEEVAGMIAQVAVSSAAYDKQLAAGAEQLARSLRQDDVKRVVEALCLATNEMETRNRALERQLERSRTRAEQLQRDVENVRLENSTDALTKIGNRRYFDEVLAKLVSEARRHKGALTLLMVDIDRFKRVNDTYGHPMGDQVLRIVAASIVEGIRDGDVSARYGGDEFGILLPNTDLSTARMIGEQVGRAIAGRELIKKSTGENLGRVTVSIGVALLRDSEPIELFTERADTCLYAAKRAGRDRVVCDGDAEVTAPTGT